MSTHDPSLAFEAWQERLWRDPLSTDLRGFALLLLVVTITLVVGLYGLVLFPPVALPRIVLATPGLIGGGLTFLGLRRIYFRVTPALTLPISLVVAAGGALCMVVFFEVLVLH